MRTLLIPIHQWGSDEEEVFIQLIPELEERDAAQFTHVSWLEWCESVSWRDKAKMLAHYRMHNMIEAHVQDAVNRYYDQESRKNRRAS